jgi:glycosyltransferase involved in cell wall biosynthesis
MFGDRELIDSLERSLGKNIENRPKRILWLTDTLTDLNGVSVTLQTIGRLADEKGYDIRILASLDPEKELDELPQSTLTVPPIHEFQLPHYEQLRIKVPSILRLLKTVYAYNPDEVYISTPGPVGLFGLMMGKMLGIRVSGIYHTDFAMEAAEIVDEPAICNMIESYNKWFYNQFDTLLVPTDEYMQLLKERGYRYRHMQRFQRGLRTEHFKPKTGAERSLAGRPPRLLYVGRVSKDKNLDFLLAVYRQLVAIHPNVGLTLVGDGPELAELKKRCRDLPRVDFPGRVAYQQLPEIYNNHDLFLFPSITDTFGMAVLEAQACGLPALVSDCGGPKEIVVDGQTGRVLSVADPGAWVGVLDPLLRDLRDEGRSCARMSRAARRRVETHYSWDRILSNMVKADAMDSPRQHRLRQQSPFKRLLKLASNMMVG